MPRPATALTLTFIALSLGSRVFAQVPGPPPPVVYLDTGEDKDFAVFISAAMTKKEVPITITTNPEKADLTMKASSIAVEKQSTGSKFARCLFAYCAGIEDQANVSVSVVDHDGTIVWSYAVNKQRGGAKNKQSMAEAIAKHFKSEYLHR